MGKMNLRAGCVHYGREFQAVEGERESFHEVTFRPVVDTAVRTFHVEVRGVRLDSTRVVEVEGTWYLKGEAGDREAELDRDDEMIPLMERAGARLGRTGRVDLVGWDVGGEDLPWE